MSVLPGTAVSRARRAWSWGTLIALLVLIGAGYLVWEKFFHEYPQQFTTQMERFKYGSIGSEEQQGIPYWIWVVLPRVFPQHLPGPGGYSSLGILWEPGHEMPIGFSKRHIGYDRVAFNCALCHTTSYRLPREDGRLTHTKAVPTGPSARFDPQNYLAFLSACANDDDFNADTLMKAIEYNIKLSLADQWLYRYLLIPGTKKALLKQTDASAWMRTRPAWGHGRIDPFNPVKFGLLKMPVDNTVGNSDMMPLWQLSHRAAASGEFHMHWDGLVTKPIDASLSGALGDGATRKSLPVKHLTELTNWLMEESTAPPAYPLDDLDRGAVTQGKLLFEWNCGSCHRTGGKDCNRPSVQKALSQDQRTDDHRLLMWNTVELPDPMNPTDPRHPATIYRNFANGYSWDLNSFVGTIGYVPTPLNGLWLRGPYLHNGSVPTVADLLNKPLSPIELRDLLASGSADTQQRLTGLLAQLERAQPPSVPPVEVEKTLNDLKPLVDQLISKARGMNRRPPVFYRGSDVVDGKRLGFDCTSAATEGRKLPIPYVTLVRGNSNAGHEYGVDLSDEQKSAIVEYLKATPLP